MQNVSIKLFQSATVGPWIISEGHLHFTFWSRRPASTHAMIPSQDRTEFYYLGSDRFKLISNKYKWKWNGHTENDTTQYRKKNSAQDYQTLDGPFYTAEKEWRRTALLHKSPLNSNFLINIDLNITFLNLFKYIVLVFSYLCLT